MPCLVRPFRVLARWTLLATVILISAVLALPSSPAQGVSSTTTLVDWGNKAPMPLFRSQLGVAAAPNGKLYAVGGTDVGPASDRVQEYDPATNVWTARTPMGFARLGLGLAAAANGRLYAVGGHIGVLTSTAVEAYDPMADVWATMAPMPTGRTGLGLAAAPNGKLYAVGGTTDTGPDGAGLTLVQEYDPVTNTWTSRTPMSKARRSFGFAAAPNGKLYAVGGRDGGVSRSDVEEYDPTLDRWTTKQSLPSPVSSMGLAAAPNGRLYAIGGVGSTNFEYDPVADRWETRAPVPTSRIGVGLATAPNGRLYAIGGNIGVSENAPVEEYDPGTDSWASKPVLQALPAPARHRAASAVANGRVYVFGGADAGGAALNSVWQYDPTTNGWDAKATMPTARFGAAAATAPNGRIYVVGGENAGGLLPPLLEEFTPPVNGAGPGSWRAGPAVAQPGASRHSLGFALAGNGRLYAVGGFGTPAGGLGAGPLSVVEELNPVTDPFTMVTGSWRDVNAMSVARHGLGLAVAGDGRLYAVGGDTSLNSTAAVTTVERFTPPAGSFGLGSWAGPGEIGQLPGPRRLLGLIGVPNGNLYAIGGRMDSPIVAEQHRAEVFDYDHLANAWATKAPMPTARRGMSLGLVGHRLFVIAGFNGGALSVNEQAILDTLPTNVSAGGPYNVPFGANVQLAAAGSDPDGDALSFAWDVDGDQVYGTAGQNPTASTAGLPPGTHTIRVRALDPSGGYTLASAALTLTPPTRLAFVTQPGGATAGASLTPQPTIQALDDQGRAVPGFTGPVTVALGTNPGGGTLGGTVTVNAVNGVATFNNLSVSAAGTGVTLIASAPGLASATSAPFTITTPPTPPSPPSPPGPCSPRPNVIVQTMRVGPGQVQTILRPGYGVLAGTLRIGPSGKPIQNASVDVQGGPSGIIASQDVPISGSEVVLTVTRREPGPVTVPLAISDGCGEWQTFVGFGPGV